MNINCKIKPAPGAKLPTRAHDTDTGDDLYAYSITIKTIYGETYTGTQEGTSVLDLAMQHECLASIDTITIDTGIAIRPQQGYAYFLCARSSLTKTGLTIPNGLGIIDNGFDDTTKLILRPLGGSKNYKDIAVGSRIAQIVYHPVIHADYEIVDTLPASERGKGSFGSTGNN